MRATAATYNGIVAFKNHVNKVDYGFKVALVALYGVIFQKPLETTHHFVRFGIFELERAFFFGFAKAYYILILRKTRADDIFGKIKIPLFACKFVEFYERF